MTPVRVREELPAGGPEFPRFVRYEQVEQERQASVEKVIVRLCVRDCVTESAWDVIMNVCVRARARGGEALSGPD